MHGLCIEALFVAASMLFSSNELFAKCVAKTQKQAVLSPGFTVYYFIGGHARAIVLAAAAIGEAME